MDLGDFVWFNMKDDVFIGDESIDEMYNGPKRRAGRIIKKTDETNPAFFWVTPIPVHQKETMPLWAIPKHLVIKMTDEELVLAMLESE